MANRKNSVEAQNKRLWTFFDIYGPVVLSKTEMASMRQYLEEGTHYTQAPLKAAQTTSVPYNHDPYIETVNYFGPKSLSGDTGTKIIPL